MAFYIIIWGEQRSYLSPFEMIKMFFLLWTDIDGLQRSKTVIFRLTLSIPNFRITNSFSKSNS